jgi:hypothetical protein
MQLSKQERQDMHSDDCVDLVESAPISRTMRLVPLTAQTPETPDPRLVDFAGGGGRLPVLVQSHVASYGAVDFWQDFLDAAHRIAVGSAVDSAAFHGPSIDASCAGHAAGCDVGAHAMLKPGSRLFICAPNRGFFWQWMKGGGLAKQSPQPLAVRNAAAQCRKLPVDRGFPADRIGMRGPTHFNVFRFLHPLRHLPLIGRWFEAKLFIACRK